MASTTQPRKANLLESMALGGTAAVFAVNFNSFALEEITLSQPHEWTHAKLTFLWWQWRVINNHHAQLIDEPA